MTSLACLITYLTQLIALYSTQDYMITSSDLGLWAYLSITGYSTRPWNRCWSSTIAEIHTVERAIERIALKVGRWFLHGSLEYTLLYLTMQACPNTMHDLDSHPHRPYPHLPHLTSYIQAKPVLISSLSRQSSDRTSLSYHNTQKISFSFPTIHLPCIYLSQSWTSHPLSHEDRTTR
jgi:hypothetical protein